MDILQVLQRPFPGDPIQGNWDCSLARPALMAYSAALKEGAASLPDSVNHCVVQPLTTCLGGWHSNCGLQVGGLLTATPPASCAHRDPGPPRPTAPCSPTIAWPSPFLNTGFLYHRGYSQTEEADPEGHRATENFLEKVTFKPSWRRQGNGQGQGVWPDMAGGGAQPSLNFVLRAEGFLVGLSAGVQCYSLGKGEDE